MEEVTALCSRLLIHVLMLLVAEDQPCYCAEKADAAFLRVVPNRLQLFEYDSITFDCEGFDDFTEWRVMRRIMGVKTICATNYETSMKPCVIQDAYSSDSGAYWCEAKGGGRSNSVNINVTAGSVILEIPALPVMEGDSVTLSCRNKNTSSVIIADFYKNGALTETGYDGNITIYSVSKSDEGLYKCIISGAGESAESWLTVKVSPLHDEEKQPSHKHVLLWIILAMFVVHLLLVLVLGLYLCGKHRVFSSKMSTPRSPSAETETVSEPTSVDHPQRDMCSPFTANMSYTEPTSSVIDSTSAGAEESKTDEYNFYYTID